MSGKGYSIFSNRLLMPEAPAKPAAKASGGVSFKRKDGSTVQFAKAKSKPASKPNPRK